MDKTDPPTSFGVFKPVGYTVIAFRSEVQVQAAVSALLAQGFASNALVRYTPAQTGHYAVLKRQRQWKLAKLIQNNIERHCTCNLAAITTSHTIGKHQ